MTKRKIIYIIFAIPIIIWLIAPFCIKKYLKTYYPNIVPENVSVYPSWVELTNVKIKYPNIYGTLNKVTVDYRLNINIDGGDINYKKTNDSLPINKENKKLSIIAKNINATAQINNSTTITLVNVSYENEIISASTIYGDYNFKIDNLKGYVTAGECSIEKLNNIFCKNIYFPFNMPFAIPKISNIIYCSAKNIEAIKSNKKIKIDLLECGDIISFKNLTFNGQEKLGGNIEKVFVNHKWLGSEPIKFSNVSFSILNKEFTNILLEINKSTLRIDAANYMMEGSASCSDWADSLPDPKQSAIADSVNNFTGTLSFKIQVKPEPKFILNNKCGYKCSSDLIKNIVSPTFKYYVYNDKNERIVRETGPAHNEWVKIEEINPHTVLAFVALEDPGFNSHNGILPEALQNSFIANLKTGKFMRGGSTITMQLAKNLWLTRDKTITRKVEEALLTVAIENCLTKEQILEIYLNVIEFGPNIYGIGKASKYYFDKHVSKLDQTESFYLASLLPNPKKGIKNPGLEYTQKLVGKLKSSGFVLDDIE